jgi:hypothetical protein
MAGEMSQSAAIPTLRLVMRCLLFLLGQRPTLLQRTTDSKRRATLRVRAPEAHAQIYVPLHQGGTAAVPPRPHGAILVETWPR